MNKIKHVAVLGLTALALITGPAYSAETVCATVKMQIKQQLTLERQGFDAEMQIHNTLDNVTLSDVNIDVKVTDELGNAVLITSDTNNTAAKFFIRVSRKENIADVSGNGVVNPVSTAVINWLLVPAPGAAGNSPLGKKYLIGATLKYKMAGETQTLEVSPDVVTVRPMPLLSLDYFLTRDVMGDDPLTAEVEPVVPYTLGVRVKNSGYAAAKSLKIDSAQPKIIENKQGLQIGFTITGSYLDDAPVQNSLLIPFGDVAAGSRRMGRWIMETPLSGTFTDFTASFSHADELGGTLTSLITGVNTHFLLRDVRVDLAGRDYVRDYLAKDGDSLRIYESDNVEDALVSDLSAQSSLAAGTSNNGNAVFRLTAPATQGFVYMRLPDPFKGKKALGQIARIDGKKMLTDNVWLSRTQNANTGQSDYWINFFDINTPGIYDAQFDAPPAAAQAPVLQVIPDLTVKEGKQISFLVDASSPDNKAVTLSTSPLPSGAQFLQQPNANTSIAKAVFDWTPAKGQAGNYLIVYTATDGTLTTTRSASIRVEVDAPPPGPGVPSLVNPLSGAEITSTTPTLIVQTSKVDRDPSTAVQFEVYQDEAMSVLVERAQVLKGVSTGDVGSTSFTLKEALSDNTRYWWRARAFDGAQTYSSWANGQFTVNQFNDAPDRFNLTHPAPAAEVESLTPTLSWTNSVDKDGDAITYQVVVYKDATFNSVITSAANLLPNPSGTTSWVIDTPLENHLQYYWKVVASDVKGAENPSPARSFIVNIGNTAPTTPLIVSPLPGSQSGNATTRLTIENALDAEKDLITYVFELDTVNSFDSGDKRSSGQMMQSSGAQTSWSVENLIENKRYFWRVKAQDGRADSAWVVGDFLFNTVNDLPAIPTIKNPGNAAWSSVLQPGLEVNPVVDPEGEHVSYQFEVYRDAALTQNVAGGVSANNYWQVSSALTDKTSYWWRVRATDTQQGSSQWSDPAVLYVSTSAYQDPTIQVTSPASVVKPIVSGSTKTVTLAWEGTDNNIEPTVALYYDTRNTGFAGQLIVDGLRQSAGTQKGSYVWNVSTLPEGAYYIYAVIYDSKGVGRAYAPGTVVISNEQPSGALQVVVKNSPLQTSESGEKATFKLRLASRPSAKVIVPVASNNPREARLNVNQLVFTPTNWDDYQTVQVIGLPDCLKDGKGNYKVLIGPTQSVDPNYMGISAKPISAVNTDATEISSATNSKNFFVCNFTVVKSKKISKSSWEYAIKAELSNSGGDVSGVSLALRPQTLKSLSDYGDVELFDPVLEFGAIGGSETIKSTDTFTIRSSKKIPKDVLMFDVKYLWKVSIK